MGDGLFSNGKTDRVSCAVPAEASGGADTPEVSFYAGYGADLIAEETEEWFSTSADVGVPDGKIEGLVTEKSVMEVSRY